MKIIFTCLSASPAGGGLEKFNRSFVRALVLTQDEVEGMSVYDKTSDFRGFDGNRTAFMLGALRAARKADVLILGHINLAPLAILAKWLRPSLRTVLIAHGIEAWSPVGWMKKRALRQADRIFAVSSYTKKRVVELHGIPESRFEILHNTLGVQEAVDHRSPITDHRSPITFDKPSYLLQRYNLTPATKILLTVCRLSSHEAYKGYDRVIEALPEVRRAIPAVRYIVAGRYDEREKARLDALINRLQLHNVVLFTGYVPEKELGDHYRLADLFVMPSVNEGFGIVFIEALAHGLPVIAGSRDGSVDALDNGNLGTLVDPFNREELVKAILDILTDEQVNSESYRLDLIKKVHGKFGFDKFAATVGRLLAGVTGH